MSNDELNYGRPWSHLSSDILSLILSNLYGKDYVCFKAVCHSWRLAPSPIRQINNASISQLIKYPSLLYFYGHKSPCNFYNPIYNNSYFIDIPELVDAQILFSKYGWMLLSRGEEIFFFQPFTKQRIDLPSLSLVYDYSFNRMCFSSPPTSSDCLVFGIVDMYDKAVYISYICRGDDSWTSFDLDNKKRLVNSSLSNPIYYKRSFLTSYNNPVFLNGVFYCLSKDGRLGIFDLTKRGDLCWTILDKPKQTPLESVEENFLVECNGELVSVFVGHLGKYVRVFELNCRRRAWQEIESLGDWMIFVSHTSSFSLDAKNFQVQGLENKIYFPRFYGSNSIFYSLATSKFHCFEDGYVLQDFNNTKQQLNCTWIEHTFQMFSSEELNWLLKNPETEQLYYFDDIIQSLSFRSNLLPAKKDTSRKAAKGQEEALIGHPWLVISHGNKIEKQTFFDISEGQHYVRNIHEVCNKNIAACAYGWLVLVDNGFDDCFLLNPTSMEKIQLPPWESSFCYEACVVTLPPDDPNCHVLFFGEFSDNKKEEAEEADEESEEADEEAEEVEETKVMHCQVGDCKWTIQTTTVTQEISRINCAISYKGKVYGITRCWRKFVIIEFNPTFTIKEIGQAFPRTNLRGTWTVHVSLVECCGELFGLGRRVHGYVEPWNIVQGIEVFKMDFSRMIWDRVDNLGDYAFFWSLYCSTCCSARKSRFKGNTIYYIERAKETRSLCSFDLEDGTISVSLPCTELENCYEAEFIMCHC